MLAANAFGIIHKKDTICEYTICKYLSIVAYEKQDDLTDQKSTLKFVKKPSLTVRDNKLFISYISLKEVKIVAPQQ